MLDQQIECYISRSKLDQRIKSYINTSKGSTDQLLDQQADQILDQQTNVISTEINLDQHIKSLIDIKS